MLESRLIADILGKLDVAYDAEVIGMPTLDECGALSLICPLYKKSGTCDAVLKTGVFENTPQEAGELRRVLLLEHDGERL